MSVWTLIAGPRWNIQAEIVPIGLALIDKELGVDINSWSSLKHTSWDCAHWFCIDRLRACVHVDIDSWRIVPGLKQICRKLYKYVICYKYFYYWLSINLYSYFYFYLSIYLPLYLFIILFYLSFYLTIYLSILIYKTKIISIYLII